MTYLILVYRLKKVFEASVGIKRYMYVGKCSF